MSDFIADTNLGHTTDLNSMKAAYTTTIKGGRGKIKKTKTKQCHSKHNELRNGCYRQKVENVTAVKNDNIKF